MSCALPKGHQKESKNNKDPDGGVRPVPPILPRATKKALERGDSAACSVWGFSVADVAKASSLIYLDFSGPRESLKYFHRQGGISC